MGRSVARASLRRWDRDGGEFGPNSAGGAGGIGFGGGGGGGGTDGGAGGGGGYGGGGASFGGGSGGGAGSSYLVPDGVPLAIGVGGTGDGSVSISFDPADTCPPTSMTTTTSRPTSSRPARPSPGSPEPRGAAGRYCRPRSRPGRTEGVAVVDKWETLAYEERGQVAVLTLNRPDVYNAFNHRMEMELQDAWRFLRRNEDVNVVVLTGAGEKAFCTGIDREDSIDDYLDDPDPTRRSEGRTGNVSTPFMFNDPGVHLCPKANDLWKPVITAVNGMACGGAFYFLGESDIIIAAETATFFDPHVSYGMVAGFETAHLLQKVPFGEGLRIALMGGHERVSAAKALQIGLVSEVVPADELLEKAVWIGERIAMSPPLAVQGTLKAAWMVHEQSRREALAQMSSMVMLGTEYANIEAGQASFHANREKPRIR